MILPSRQLAPKKAAPDKSKMLKKAEGDESPQATVISAKAVLNKAQKARNEVQE